MASAHATARWCSGGCKKLLLALLLLVIDPPAHLRTSLHAVRKTILDVYAVGLQALPYSIFIECRRWMLDPKIKQKLNFPWKLRCLEVVHIMIMVHAEHYLAAK
mmetsp:Transcript_32237/g.97063  ORF Transcript_32237/g.97063 Transcript_32237/m.97063 type:complete len:104 (-) Transcript_32237:792-1103(-)